MNRSEALFERAKNTIPGGVNSPVRAFKAVGGTPRFMERSDGAYIWDADGQRYIDYVLSWGPMIMGHNHPEVREAVIKAGLYHGLTDFGVIVSHNHRAPRQYVVDIALTVRVPNISAVRALHKPWGSPYGFKRSNRRIDSAGYRIFGALEQCFRSVHNNSALLTLTAGHYCRAGLVQKVLN